MSSAVSSRNPISARFLVPDLIGARTNPALGMRVVSVSIQVVNGHVPEGLAAGVGESLDGSTTRVVRSLKGIRPLPA